MRLITNEEVKFISGGEGDNGTETVEIIGQRMSIWDKLMYDLFEDGKNGQISMADYDLLQTAYQTANATGNSVNIEISHPSTALEANFSVFKITTTSGEIKFFVTVDPAN